MKHALRCAAWALSALATLAGLCAAGAVQAQSSDATRALNLLNTLIRPAATPAAAPVLQAAPGAARTGDVLQLLQQSLDQIDEPREIEIGRQMAAVLLGSKPLHPDLKLQRYVNQLGRWISLQSARPQLPWSFAVLDDAGYNAFAAPGGYVFVTRGLLERVGSEAELAGILAHEIIHVTGRHHLKALQAKARAGLLTQAVASQLNNNAGGMLSAQLLALGRNLYASGLDQGDEFDADREGVTLAARAGFDPYGLVTALQQLRGATPDDPLFTLSLSTHPPAQQRLDRLGQAMGERLAAFGGKPPVPLAQRLAR